jgi:hemolysin III
MSDSWEHNQFEQGRVATAVTTRPFLRGTLHGAAALLAPAALVLLLLLADSPRGYVGAAIFATSLMLLYWTSASYHLAPWPHRLQRIMMRLDHSMIFILIAGTYTPFCLIVVGDAWGIPMLSVVWTLAGLGVLLKVCWPDAPRWLSVALYIALGWLGIVAAWPLVNNLPAWGLAMLLGGGLLYTLGALVYARRWPDPYPRVFGYHEVFHAFVVAATALHFSLIAIELV